ncbi:serine/threonine-protein kinase PLK4-like [Myripristis murdjan]|uniref:serine/threonine-protein kinase PLK4-like n=1 Tax=Myripristis murdjan TaxID=586833 RepID=UPI001175DDCC|nr:serine/threonine-protein kinase PLK4-like [Myripristis murdjan]
MALKYIHDKQLLHKDLKPESVFLTEFGTVCLGGFGRVGENSTSPSATNSNSSDKGAVSYLAPETLTDGDYNSKSDIWSVGCILYELCTLTLAFSAETTIKLIPKILCGSYPSLPECYSPELRVLLSDIFSKDPKLRPTASEILGRPFIIHFLSAKSKETVKELQTNLDKLRTVADGLERVHQGTTIGSLTGGVIGAAGGITSIVGLILTPFTLGASLVVTGVGIGVAAAGGLTAGVSNITNMVNQSSDRKTIRRIIQEFQEKIEAVVMWVQEISEGLELLRRNCDSADSEGSIVSQEMLARLGLRAGRGLAGVAELVRLIQVMNIGKVAAQTARAVRVAEVAGGVLAGLFVAADVFFIAMDAKEIHSIRQAKAAEAAIATDRACSETVPENYTTVSESRSDRAALVPNTEKSTTEQKAQSTAEADTIKSEIMKFVQSIRQTAEKLQQVLKDLDSIIPDIPSSPSPEG